MDALKTAVEEWGAKETTRIDNEAKFIRQVWKGRTGNANADKAGTQNLAAISQLLFDEIGAFIEFGGDSER